MTGPIEAAKKIAAPGPNDEPKPPCKHAVFQKRHPCKGHMWLCSNDESEAEGMVVEGNSCRRCENRDKT